MKITKTIPEQNQEQRIDVIQFHIEELTADCMIEIMGTAKSKSQSAKVYLTPILNAATSKELIAVEKFFKRILAQGYGIDESEITDTVFDLSSGQ